MRYNEQSYVRIKLQNFNETLKVFLLNKKYSIFAAKFDPKYDEGTGGPLFL